MSVSERVMECGGCGGVEGVSLVRECPCVGVSSCHYTDVATPPSVVVAVG